MNYTLQDRRRILCEAITADRHDGRMSDIRWAWEEFEAASKPKPKPVPIWKKVLDWSGKQNQGR